MTTKRGELETRDEIKRRIEDASRFVDLDQICLSPQCGFASTAEGNDLTYEEQVAKLRLVVEVADEVWVRGGCVMALRGSAVEAAGCVRAGQGMLTTTP